MIKMFRRIAVFFVISAILLLGACNDTKNENTADKSLYEHGLEVISSMVEMANSQQYLSLYSDSANVLDLISAAGAGDFSKPAALYKITSSDSSGTILDFIQTDELSETLKKHIKSRMLSVIATQINAMGGSEALSASSLCISEKLFVSNELEENEIYLYTYKDAVPVAVTFTKGENGAVSASGIFILYKDFTLDTILGSSELLKELGIEIEEITEKIPKQ